MVRNIMEDNYAAFAHKLTVREEVFLHSAVRVISVDNNTSSELPEKICVTRRSIWGFLYSGRPEKQTSPHKAIARMA